MFSVSNKVTKINTKIRKIQAKADQLKFAEPL